VLIVISTLRLWNGESASWHFIDVPPADATEIRIHSLTSRGGFGSVKVEATIGDIVWRTSVFPQKSGGYLLPVKRAVRSKAGIAAGDEVRIELDLL
jgi:hypothetical protein